MGASSAKRDRDIVALIEQVSAEDLDVARELITIITERGYHHGRDLMASLDRWLSTG